MKTPPKNPGPRGSLNKKMDVRIMSQDNVLTPIDTEINKVNRTG